MYLYGIYQSQISHHGHLPYFTIHHFGTEMCTRLFQIDAWWDIGNVHCGIWELIYYLSVWLTHWGLKKRLQMIFCKIFVNQQYQNQWSLQWRHTVTSQITSLTIVYSTVYSGTDQRKHQNSASLAFERGIHRWPHNGPVMRKMFPFDDVIIYSILWLTAWRHKTRS